MYDQDDEQFRKQMGQILQGIKGKVRAANQRTSDEELSSLEQVTEQWLDLVSSFITPIGSGSALDNGKLMELARHAMGSSEITEIFKQFGFANMPDMATEQNRASDQSEQSTQSDQEA